MFFDRGDPLKRAINLFPESGHHLHLLSQFVEIAPDRYKSCLRSPYKTICVDTNSVPVVVTANPGVAVRRPRIARVVVITVRAISETIAECGPEQKAPREAPAAKAAIKVSTGKITASELSAREARGNTTADKITTGKVGASKVTNTTAACKATASVPTSKASSPKAAASKPSAAKTSSTSAHSTSADTVSKGYGISWN
jgi:hypothetical protein